MFPNGRIKHGKLSRELDFDLQGVTPGKYRVKIVWAKGRPSPLGDDKGVCRPRPGDYESTSSPVISIDKGGVTDGVRVDCTELVKK